MTAFIYIPKVLKETFDPNEKTIPENTEKKTMRAHRTAVSIDNLTKAQS